MVAPEALFGRGRLQNPMTAGTSIDLCRSLRVGQNASEYTQAKCFVAFSECRVNFRVSDDPPPIIPRPVGAPPSFLHSPPWSGSSRHVQRGIPSLSWVLGVTGIHTGKGLFLHRSRSLHTLFLLIRRPFQFHPAFQFRIVGQIGELRQPALRLLRGKRLRLHGAIDNRRQRRRPAECRGSRGSRRTNTCRAGRRL